MNWAMSIKFTSTEAGIKVEISKDVQPQFESVSGEVEELATLTGKAKVDPLALLKNTIATHIDFKTLVANIKHTLEGTWAHVYPGLSTFTLANSLFTSSGDFMCELRPPAAELKAHAEFLASIEAAEAAITGPKILGERSGALRPMYRRRSSMKR